VSSTDDGRHNGPFGSKWIRGGYHASDYGSQSFSGGCGNEFRWGREFVDIEPVGPADGHHQCDGDYVRSSAMPSLR
jgi:hypothetical protein